METDKLNSQLKREEVENLLNYAITQSAIGDSVEKITPIIYQSPDQNGADVVDIFLRINPTKENSTRLMNQLGRMQARLNNLIYVTKEVKDLFSPTSEFKRPLWFSYPEDRTPCIAVHGFIRFERKSIQVFDRTMDKLAVLEGALENQLLLVIKNSGKLGENFTSGNIFVDNMEHVDCKVCPAFVNLYFCQNALLHRSKKKRKTRRNTTDLFEGLQEEMQKSFKKFTILGEKQVVTYSYHMACTRGPDTCQTGRRRVFRKPSNDLGSDFNQEEVREIPSPDVQSAEAGKLPSTNEFYILPLPVWIMFGKVSKIYSVYSCTDKLKTPVEFDNNLLESNMFIAILGK
ncbi:hypothetical protein PHET_00838 [Paragonimus heterotremus]|uniref:Uncharacterized protein n=1 Tax=Paragonimus heterotremus TaxID=100268 RepID=A0A8J4SUD3_9TREM|nr:hypothetical protein PHET_00838 [Paragonimus heterotremus]